MEWRDVNGKAVQFYPFGAVTPTQQQYHQAANLNRQERLIKYNSISI
jgi:hypothetical protein